MNTETLTAIKQVNLLVGQLQDALNDKTLTDKERSLIEQACNDQTLLRDTLINDTLGAMVDNINAANGDLTTLMAKMQKTSDKLAKIATTIKKVSDMVGTLAEITEKAISAGLLGGA
jgi:methyl-accepting chemotaxis protein